MAPDRGCYNFCNEFQNEQRLPVAGSTSDEGTVDAEDNQAREASRRRSDARRFLARQSADGQNFTLRGVLVGLGVGLLICFSNTFFGLQTGWVSGMTMPASLLGFAFFKAFANQLDSPFSPVENVLVQTVATSVGTMPLGSGFVGVIPAIEFMLKPSEQGPLPLSLGKLMIWALGLCFFGVVFAVPLRKEVIIREKLKFPSGTATALMIGVLHGSGAESTNPEHRVEGSQADGGESSRLLGSDQEGSQVSPESTSAGSKEPGNESDRRGSWRSKINLLLRAFGISGFYALLTYFVPLLRNLPVFGLPLATHWLWTLNPSPAYVGQGIIMGPATTLHMMLGAVVGWGILSPLAKYNGWAPGPVGNWENGSKGWIIWISLAIMLADSVVSLGLLASRPLFRLLSSSITGTYHKAVDSKSRPSFLSLSHPQSSTGGYTALAIGSDDNDNNTAVDPATNDNDNDNDNDYDDDNLIPSPSAKESAVDPPDVDAPPSQLISARTVVIGLILSLLVCVGSIQLTFGHRIPLYATLSAILMALVLSVMGVRAQGETDLNPVSGISKLTQLSFALIIPASNPHAVLINLVAGAVSESGALQAGDMMQDLKTGHLLGASPRAQFYGQLIGSAVGAVASAAIYKLYTSVYTVPGELFQLPTGFVWIFTARLVTGDGLPPRAAEGAAIAAALFAVATLARVLTAGSKWQSWIPGGIAVAVGMYNVPSFTIARTIGGLTSWYWQSRLKRDETTLVILASGMILGEGVIFTFYLYLQINILGGWLHD